jgi:hypothetical protein
MTVPLPETGDGSRRRRRRGRQRSGARRALTRIAALVLLVAVVGAVGWVVVDALGDDGGDGGSSPSTVPSDSDGPEIAAPSLVVLRDETTTVYGVTVFVPATSTIVHIAPGTLLEVPTLGLVPLRDATDELLAQALENVLGVHFGGMEVLSPEELVAAVRDAGTLTVQVDDPVEDLTDTGRVTVVVPSGTQALDPEVVPTFLEVVGDGTSLQRLVRHQEFWSSYLETGSDAIAAVASLGRGDVLQRVLPVEAVAGIEGDDELYRIVESDLTELIERVFPDAAAQGPRVRVQILNGVGLPGIAERVQPLLVDAGGRMTLSGNADRFDYQVTQVVYYDDEDLAAARAIQEALGVGEVVKSLTGLDVVDVTVVIGADFVAANPGG